MICSSAIYRLPDKSPMNRPFRGLFPTEVRNSYKENSLNGELHSLYYTLSQALVEVGRAVGYVIKVIKILSDARALVAPLELMRED